MSGFVSRVLVGIVGLPIVLGVVWLGGWWLFGLVAVAGVVAVHEFVTTARPLRPLAPALYLGVVLALVGARTGGIVWMLGGFLATFVFAFVLNRSRRRGRRRRSRSARRSSGRRGSDSGSGFCSCSGR